jgi:hypothetical protein
MRLREPKLDDRAVGISLDLVRWPDLDIRALRNKDGSSRRKGRCDIWIAHPKPSGSSGNHGGEPPVPWMWSYGFRRPHALKLASSASA